MMVSNQKTFNLKRLDSAIAEVLTQSERAQGAELLASIREAFELGGRIRALLDSGKGEDAMPLIRELTGRLKILRAERQIPTESVQ
jgi:hypothetical protein